MPGRLHDSDYAVFVRHLAQARQDQGVTQAELAGRLDRPQPYISKIERGDIDLPGEETRAKIHQALGTTEDDLVRVGVLERIESPVDGGEPVYIQAEHITPGDRAAAAAQQGMRVLPEPGPPWVIERDDPRAEILAMLDGASPAKLGTISQLVRVLTDTLPDR